MSSILCLSDFLRVNFGLIWRKNPILACCWELYFSIFRYARFSRRISIIPLVELYLEPYFNWKNCVLRFQSEWDIHSFCDVALSLVGGYWLVFFIGWEFVTIRNASFVLCNDDSSLTDLFDYFENSLVNFGWVNWFIFLQSLFLQEQFSQTYWELSF